MSNSNFSTQSRQFFPLKAGIALQGYGLVGITNDSYLVPIEHKDAVAFIGTVDMQYALEELDNSTGNNGDKSAVVLLPELGIAPEALTEPLDLTNENIGQPIFASGQRTLHASPSKGRFPIGVLTYVGPSSENPNKTYYWINMAKKVATYRA